MPQQETPLQRATREVKDHFTRSLGGTQMNEDAWAYYNQVFRVTLQLAINQHGALIWQGRNRLYVLQQVRLIARIARYLAKKDRNSQTIKKKHIVNAADIGIEQARYECAAGQPGQSCQGYNGPIP